MTTLLLQALALTFMHGQPAMVSFSCRAEPMSRLVVDLGKATGQNLTVAAACADDVIVVSAHDVSSKTLLDEIAKVDSGQWKPTDNGYIFTADVIARRSEERHENDHRAREIQQIIDKGLADAAKAENEAAKKPPASGDTAAMIAAMNGPTPEKTAVLKLLRGIDPSLLSNDPEHRSVFSTRPNQMQQALGSDAEEVIEDLIKKHNEKIPKNVDPNAVSNAVPGLSGDDPSTDFMKKYVGRMMQPVTGYYKADLVVGSMPYVQMLTATLVLYDSKGDVLMNVSDPLDTSILQMLLAKPATADQSLTPVELSPESQAFMKLISGQLTSMGQSKRSIPPLLRPFLQDPEHHDPLALMTSDKLLALAKARQKPLVAVVPDADLSIMNSIGGGTPTVESFVKELEQGKTMVKDFQNGWIEIKPSSPESARQNRTERSALGKLLRISLGKGLPSLDDIAEFAQKAPSPMNPGVTQAYLSLFVPGGMTQGMEGVTNWDMYRIYGQIGQDRKQALLAGSKVSLDTLSLPQQNYLAEMVFGPMAQLQVGNSTGDEANIMTQMMSFAMGGQDYKDEPTELLPSGVPGGGTFEMTATDEPFVSPVPKDADGSEIQQVVGADELAIMKYFSAQPQFAAVANMMPKYDKMKVGSRTVYHLTFHLTNNVRLTGTLRDNRLPGDAEIVSADNLPSNLQDMINKKIDGLKKSPLGALAGMAAAAGAKTPPPSQ